MKAMICSVILGISMSAFAGGASFESFFRKNATPERLGLPEVVNGVKTEINLLGCHKILVADEFGNYGVCNFEAIGFQLMDVYSVIANPDGHGLDRNSVRHLGSFMP